MRLIRIAGLIIWAAIGAQVISGGSTDRMRMIEWTAAFIVFGAAFALRSSRVSLLLQTGAVMVIAHGDAD